MADETSSESTTGEKGFKLTSKATGEFVAYLIAHECTPAKTLTAEECSVAEAQAWIDEQAAKEEAERQNHGGDGESESGE